MGADPADGGAERTPAERRPAGADIAYLGHYKSPVLEKAQDQQKMKVQQKVVKDRVHYTLEHQEEV